MMAAMGWSEDQFRLLFQPLVEQGQEAVWSMGDDAPPASLSTFRRPLWDYCKQRFAQVTNPPIDSLRETHVMSLKVFLGRASLNSPLLDGWTIAPAQERAGHDRDNSLHFPQCGWARGSEGRSDSSATGNPRLVGERPGPNFADRPERGRGHAPLPALLALAAAWKAMVEAGAHDIPLVIETGQVIDTHHIALLVAAGRAPYFRIWRWSRPKAFMPGGADSYRGAVEKGLRKVIARMGISTIASYRNSHLFEIIGLDPDVSDFFEDANCSLAGKSLTALLQDCIDRHAAAFSRSDRTTARQRTLSFPAPGRAARQLPLNWCGECTNISNRPPKKTVSPSWRSASSGSRWRSAIFWRLFPATAAAGSGRIGGFHPEPVQYPGHVIGSYFTRNPPDASHCDEPVGGRSNTGEGGEDPGDLSRRWRGKQSRQADCLGAIRCNCGISGAR